MATFQLSANRWKKVAGDHDLRSRSCTVKVTTGTPGWYPADTRPPGMGTFETGPATPPLGTGSFELRTLTNPEKVVLVP